MILRALTGLAVALATTLVVRWWRDYPWLLAVLSGASLGALSFVTLQTVVRLRATLAQFGGDGSPGEGSSEDD